MSKQTHKKKIINLDIFNKDSMWYYPTLAPEIQEAVDKALGVVGKPRLRLSQRLMRAVLHLWAGKNAKELL